MIKEKRDIGAELITAMEEVVAYSKGEPTSARPVNMPDDIDIRGFPPPPE